MVSLLFVFYYLEDNSFYNLNIFSIVYYDCPSDHEHSFS